MTRITQNGSREVVLGAVLFDRLRGRRRVGIDQPELGAAAAEFLRETLQLGSVAIGDGAVGAHENENTRAGWGRERVVFGGGAGCAREKNTECRRGPPHIS